MRIADDPLRLGDLTCNGCLYENENYCPRLPSEKVQCCYDDSGTERPGNWIWKTYTPEPLVILTDHRKVNTNPSPTPKPKQLQLVPITKDCDSDCDRCAYMDGNRGKCPEYPNDGTVALFARERHMCYCDSNGIPRSGDWIWKAQT